jgi:N-acetylneuraminate synthase
MARTIKIGRRAIGSSERCFVIAEACDNHLGNIEVAKEMVRQAKACGVDAIKFQHHLPDEEMLRDGVPTSTNFDIPLYDFLQRYALKLEQHYQLFSYCKELGIIYLCTPFSRKAAEEMHKMGVEAYKIGSGELTDLPTLKVIAAFGKPMILSTGMAEWSEIDETVATIRPINDQIVLMNCVSEYPAIHADVNLNVIQEMARRYDVIVGHSDHTPDIYTSIAAVALGAKLIEKHFILDRRQPGPDRSVSIEPYEFSELVKGVHRVEEALGSNKRVHELEQPIRSWAHRSVVSLRPIAKGSQISADMVWTKRPGTGIAAKHLEDIISRTALCDIPADHLIQWEEIA